jgi:CDP-diacylglycerol--glycerol-3-phosphate 3-phosphatidyltransferase
LGKWKTGLQLTYCITCLVWLVARAADPAQPVAALFRYLSRPDGWLQPASLWLALALTLLSGWHYLWGSRRLLIGR